MDSETDIPNGEGFGYPPQIYTHPYIAATLPLTETEPSNPEGPQGKFIGDYLVICVKKYERYWWNALDWDADPIDIEQPNTPTTNTNNNNKTNKQPLLSNFGNKRTKVRTRPSSLKPVQMPLPKGDDEESDWNENMYLHQYCAKVQSQVPIRQPPPGWSNWRNKISTVTNSNKSLNNNEKRDTYVMPEEIPNNIIIKNPKTISQEEFDKM